MTESILLFLIAAVLIYFGIRLLRRTRVAMKMAQSSLQWPRATGRITASSVLFVDEGGDPPTGYYLPQVSYNYTVGDLTYAGTGIAFRSMKSWKKTAEAIVVKYPVGSDTVVYYDPGEPGRSVLEPGTAGVGKGYFWATVMFISAILIAATSVVMLIIKG